MTENRVRKDMWVTGRWCALDGNLRVPRVTSAICGFAHMLKDRVGSSLKIGGKHYVYRGRIAEAAHGDRYFIEKE